MKKIFLFMVMILTFNIVDCQSYLIGQSIPSYDLKNLDGKIINTANLNSQGKPIIMVFWTLWCPPCKKLLNDIQGEYNKWNKEWGISVVAISNDDREYTMRVADTVSKYDWPFEILLDPNRDFSRVMGVVPIPESFIINNEGKIVWSQTGDVVDIIKEMNIQLKSLDPKDAEDYYNRGNSKFNMQDYQGAISDYSKAIEFDPKFAAAYSKRGSAKVNMEDYQSAISDCSKAIEIDPKIADAYYYLGLIYFTEKNCNAAIEISEKALKLNIIDPYILDNLGYYYMEQGNYDYAIQRFKDCMKIENNPMMVDATFGISLAYFYNKDKHNAKKYYSKAKTLVPVLNGDTEGSLELDKLGYSYSEKNKETLKIMFEDFK